MANQLLQTIEAAVKSVTDQRTDQRVKREARNEAEQTLIGNVRALTSELKAVLKPSDTRWLDFVSEVPADPQRPEAVTGVLATETAPGELELVWPPTPRAERYQVEVLVAGQDPAFRRMEMARAANASLKGREPRPSMGGALFRRRGAFEQLGLPSVDRCASLPIVKRVSSSATSLARARRIFLRLRGVRGVDEEELWQHALFFAKSPEERCRLSLQTARSALSLRRSAKRKLTAS
jgi:hypothetical protein